MCLVFFACQCCSLQYAHFYSVRHSICANLVFVCWVCLKLRLSLYLQSIFLWFSLQPSPVAEGLGCYRAPSILISQSVHPCHWPSNTGVNSLPRHKSDSSFTPESVPNKSSTFTPPPPKKDCFIFMTYYLFIHSYNFVFMSSIMELLINISLYNPVL